MKFKNFVAIVSYFRLYGANTATLCWRMPAVMAEMLPNKEAISEMFYRLHCFFAGGVKSLESLSKETGNSN